MAKAKSKLNSKLKTKSKRNSNDSPTLPDGYKVIGRAPNWDPEKNPLLVGERGPTKEVEFVQPPKKGQKKGETRTVRTMVVTDETIGPRTVWESGMLVDFFDNTEDGDSVRIEYLGLGTAKKGQNAPKIFSCAVKS